MRNKRKDDKRKNEKKVCYFCESGNLPNYKDTLVLRRFISERGRIVSAGRTGTCSKHQRKLSKEIKKSRYLALLFYTESHAI